MNTIKEVEDYWEKLGPGLTTGAADDDPSGIATYSQTGAHTGFRLLWLSAFTFPLMAIIQEMCARLGLVTGQGLAANIRDNYSRKALYVTTILLFAANTFNLGVNLGVMAKAVQLLWPRGNFLILVLFFTVLCFLMQVFVSYKTYARYLKYLALILFSYVISALLTNLDWHALAVHAFLPKMLFNKDEIFLVTAILGTTISPYLFFWQTSQEVEEEILQGKATLEERRVLTNPVEIRNMRVDVWTGMFISNLVMFFIIAACAATLHAAGITEINSAAQAAEALRPLAGNAAFFLFTLGIIGTGLLSVPVLAGSASYAISESFRWQEGLYRKLKDAYAFYGVIFAAMLIGFFVNIAGLDPIKALIWSAVGNGLIAPVILFFIVHLSSKKDVMGAHVNKASTTWIGWVIVGIMAVASIATIISLFL